ncbi:MAG: 4Fe-4S dicluster domain-containing protein [Candidatus Hodarchaeales archaeon]|jgi:2-oxoglutarate ferredoxin oxidoreductase subunit delta
MALKKPSEQFLGPDAIPEKKQYRVHVIKDRCKGCLICVEFCPREILILSEDFNVKGYHPPRLKDGVTADECSGCLFCQLACPEFSIFIREENNK